MLKKIVSVGGNNPAFKRGSQDLLVLAAVTVPAKQVERLTAHLGKERPDERDAAVAAYLARPLAQPEDPPAAPTPPPRAVVEMDGGRLQSRAAQATPEATAAETAATPEGRTAAPSGVSDPDTPAATTPEPGSAAERRVQSKHWREDKVGCLLERKGAVSDVAACPEIPSVFVDPLQSLKVAQAIGHGAVPPGAPFQRAQPDEEESAAAERRTRPGRPEIVSRRVLATRQDVDAFGPLLAAAAWAMGRFNAARRAFVADGSSENWTAYKRYFFRRTAVLDFVPAMTYGYAAAVAGRPSRRAGRCTNAGSGGWGLGRGAG